MVTLPTGRLRAGRLDDQACGHGRHGRAAGRRRSGGHPAAGGLEFELRPLVSVPGDDVEVVLLAAAVLCVPLLIVSMFLRRRAQRESEGDEFGWLRRLVLLAVLVASVLVLRELLPALDEVPRPRTPNPPRRAPDPPR